MQHLEELLPLDRLNKITEEAELYKTASPFPHIVIENFLNEDFLKQLMRDFPGPQDHEWLRYKSKAENDKLQSTNELSMPSSVRNVINAFNSSTFVKFLEKLTGISGIVPDPHLYGGGMHQTLPGGKLGVHVDYNKHEKWDLDRRLNLLLYLNEEWDENWDGALQLWDTEIKHCAKKIYPIANRVVIFSTTETSWHGHPDPLQCPKDRTRKSIALYYYTNGRPEEEKAESHNTLFRERPGEKFQYTFRDILREVTPPILIKAAKKLIS